MVAAPLFVFFLGHSTTKKLHRKIASSRRYMVCLQLLPSIAAVLKSQNVHIAMYGWGMYMCVHDCGQGMVHVYDCGWGMVHVCDCGWDVDIIQGWILFTFSKRRCAGTI